MKFFVTGDVHGSSRMEKLRKINLERVGMSAGDILWIAGDFGIPWGGRKTYEDELALNVLETMPYIFAVVPGNHENYDLLETYPVVNWYGAKAWQLRENIFAIHRGEIATINDTSFFCMGGGYSIDKAYRTIGISYWEQELPCKEEYDTAIANLAKVNHRVDYIITHAASVDGFNLWSTFFTYRQKPVGELEMFLQEVAENVDFLHWYFGHYHADLTFDDDYTVIYEQIKLIE